MKKSYFACILFVVYLSTKAQTVHPGGVKDISVWNVAEQDASGRYGWLDMLAGIFSIQAATGTKLNAHSSAWFDGDKNTFVIPLKTGISEEGKGLFFVWFLVVFSLVFCSFWWLVLGCGFCKSLFLVVIRLFCLFSFCRFSFFLLYFATKK